MKMPKPNDDFDDINEKFIDIIQSNDFDFPIISEVQVTHYDFDSGFVVLPLPLDVLELWRELLEGGNGNDFIE